MRITEVVIDYAEPTFPGGLRVSEMQEILVSIDWTNDDSVARQTTRCNNRCNGNDVEVSVPTLKTTMRR